MIRTLYYKFKRLFLISTFLGVVAHEYAHKQAALTEGMEVIEVTYFQLGDPLGEVIHQEPESYKSMFVISGAPFIFNTAFGFTIFFGSMAYVSRVGIEALARSEILGLIALSWIGVSLCLHAFPSTTDINNIWNSAKRKWGEKPFGILGTPIFLIRHLNVILSLPILLVLVIADKTTEYGSHFIFTGGIIYLAHLAMDFAAI